MTTAEERANSTLENAIEAMEDIKADVQNGKMQVARAIWQLANEAQDVGETVLVADNAVGKKYVDKLRELANFIAAYKCKG